MFKRFVFGCNSMSIIFLVFMYGCTTQRKHIAIDLQLKNHALVQQYIQNPVYKIDFHDTDILLQRKNLGKKYELMFLLSHKKYGEVVDSLALFEVDNQNNKGIIVFPRTPSPLTPLMSAYYPSSSSKVYANTTAEMLNYLQTGYAGKTWITALDTGLCEKRWKKNLLHEKIYLIKVHS
jgi:hypothetical protein